MKPSELLQCMIDDGVSSGRVSDDGEVSEFYISDLRNALEKCEQIETQLDEIHIIEDDALNGPLDRRQLGIRKLIGDVPQGRKDLVAAAKAALDVLAGSIAKSKRGKHGRVQESIRTLQTFLVRAGNIPITNRTAESLSETVRYFEKLRNNALQNAQAYARCAVEHFSAHAVQVEKHGARGFGGSTTINDTIAASTESVILSEVISVLSPYLLDE